MRKWSKSAGPWGRDASAEEASLARSPTRDASRDASPSPNPDPPPSDADRPRSRARRAASHWRFSTVNASGLNHPPSSASGVVSRADADASEVAEPAPVPPRAPNMLDTLAYRRLERDSAGAEGAAASRDADADADVAARAATSGASPAQDPSGPSGVSIAEGTALGPDDGDPEDARARRVPGGPFAGRSIARARDDQLAATNQTLAVAPISRAPRGVRARAHPGRGFQTNNDAEEAGRGSRRRRKSMTSHRRVGLVIMQSRTDPTPAFRSSRYARSLPRGGGGVVRTSCRPWFVHRRPVSHVSRLTRFASARPAVASSLSRLTSTAPAAPAAASAAGLASALLRAATHRRYRSWLHLSTRT